MKMPNQPEKNTDEKTHFPKSKVWRIVSSAAIAFILWFYVISVFRTEVEIPFRGVRVEFEGASALEDRNLKLISDTDLEVDLKLNGQRSVLNSLRSSDLTVRVDLTRIYEAGTRGLPYEIVYPGDVATSGIEVVSRNPDSITVTVVSWAEKRVDVREPVINGTPGEGFRLGAIESEDWSPKRVKIGGPKEVIERIEYARLVVDVEGVTESKEVRQSFVYYDGDGNRVEDIEAVKANPEDGQVRIPVLMDREVAMKLPLEIDKNLIDTEFTISATVTLTDGTKKEIVGVLFNSADGLTSEDPAFEGLTDGQLILNLGNVLAYGPLKEMEYVTVAQLPDLALDGVIRKEYTDQDFDLYQDGIHCDLQSIVVTVESRTMTTRDFNVSVKNENQYPQFTVVRPAGGYVVTLKGFEEDLLRVSVEDIIVVMPNDVTTEGTYQLQVAVANHPEVEVLAVPYVTLKKPLSQMVSGGVQQT